MELDALHHNKERLTAKVKTLEREVAQRARASAGRAPGPTAQGEAEGATAERAGGAPNAASSTYPTALWRRHWMPTLGQRSRSPRAPLA